MRLPFVVDFVIAFVYVVDCAISVFGDSVVDDSEVVVAVEVVFIVVVVVVFGMGVAATGNPLPPSAPYVYEITCGGQLTNFKMLTN